MKTAKYQEPLNLKNALTIKLISIDPKMVADFKRRNPHIRIDDEKLGAKEENLSPKDIEPICSTEIAEAAKAAKGSIGNAHSIFKALQECAAQEKHYLILEDDVTLHPNTMEFLAENWEKAGAADFLALGANTDAPITFEPIYGMMFSGLFLRAIDYHPSYSRIEETLRAYSQTEVSICRLHNMLGNCAFMISPSGARKFLDKAFPLNSTPIDIPLLPDRMIGISFDRRMNAILESINAKICIPFLAIRPAGRANKAWGRTGRRREDVVAMGVAWTRGFLRLVESRWSRMGKSKKGLSSELSDIKTAKNQEPLNLKNALTIKLISIDPARVADFKRRNPHIRIDDEKLGAKEENLSPKDIEPICSTEIAEAAKAAKGSIGNAHSIFKALQECAAQEKHYLILEDDVTLHPNTMEFLAENWEKAGAADFLALGANTDAPITFEPIYGMRFSGAFLRAIDKHPSYSRIEETLRAYSQTEVSIYGLQNMFGTCAFMISPSGALKFLDKAFPLDSTPINVPLVTDRMIGISFDRRMNAILESIDAKICIPFLAITPNDTKSQR